MDEIENYLLDNELYQEWLHGTSKPLTDEDKRSLEGIDLSIKADSSEGLTEIDWRNYE